MKYRYLPFIEPLETRIALAFGAVVELSDLNGTNGLRIDGEVPGGGGAFVISDAGDFNNDGIADLLIGAPAAGSGGAAYVVFGTAAGFPATVSLTALNGSNGFKIPALSTGHELGVSVSGVGDFSGDGIDDIVVGAPSGGPSQEGVAYVLFGSSTAFSANFNLATLDGQNGVAIVGVETGDATGMAVAAADVNGDGFEDVMVGAPFVGLNSTRRGAAYVVYGGPGIDGGTINLSGLPATDGFTIIGENIGDELGRFLNPIGDVNDDNIADIAIAAPFSSPNGTGSGTAYVIFGNSSGFAATFNLSGLNGGNGFRVTGTAADDNLGSAVRGAGDINADGVADMIIGAVGADPGGSESGAAYVIFGKTTAFSASIDPANLNGTNGFRISGLAAGDRLGSSVSGLADVNADGFGDIIVTAPPASTSNGANSGAAFVIFGKSTAFTASVDLAGLNGRNGFKINGAAVRDFAGFSGSRGGDFNGDGAQDIMLSATGTDANGINSGAGYVVFGLRSPIVVNTTLDVIDPGDGVLSLREAIQLANSQLGLDSIEFNIPGPGVRTITINTVLPDITDPVVIDGFTQPGSTANTNGPGQGFNSVLLVQLLGGVGNSFDGLRLATGDSTIRGLVISGFINSAAIHLLGGSSDRNLIEGNFLGTNAAGTSAAGSDDGVLVRGGSSGNVIRGNLISGNSASAITMFGEIEFGVTGNRIVGNLIGTDKAGLAAIPNDEAIVVFNNVIGNLIGGATAADRNVISGNDGEGIALFGAPGGGRPANNNVIQGNYIGVDVTGAARLANNGDGIDLFTDATGNQILDNIISGNTSDGVAIFDDVLNTVIRGNRIGTNAAGTAAIGNGGAGISLFSNADGTIIGAGDATDFNVISGNGTSGISVSDSVGVLIQGNLIGLAINGVDALPNIEGSGISVFSGNVTIGGVEVGHANLIAFNGRDGIEASGNSTVSIVGNLIFSNTENGVNAPGTVFAEISRNSIFSNGLLGIERGQATSALPVVSSSSRNAGGFVEVSGTFAGTPSSTYTVEVFMNFVADPSGFGEGKDFIGSVLASTDASGNATFSFTDTEPPPPGAFVTVTILDPDGNTSSFSNASALASSITWTGAISEDWFNAGNWSPIGVPGPADSVTLNTASIIRLPADAEVASLTLNDGLLTGLGQLTISGLFTWTGGAMAGLGITNAEGGVLINGGEVVLQQRTLNIASNTSASLTGESALLRLKGGALLNNAGSFFATTNNGILDAEGQLSLIRNTGSFVRSGPAADFLVDVPFVNEGNIQISGGSLIFGNGLVQTDTATLLGPGNVTFTGGVVSASGIIGTDVRNSGALLSPGGIKQVGSLVIQGSYSQSSSGRLVLDISGTVPGSGFDVLTIQDTALLNGVLEVNTLGAFILQPSTSFGSIVYDSVVGNFASLDAPSGVSTQLDGDGLTLLAELPPPGQKSFEFTDTDGDLVLVKVNKGTIPQDAFTIGLDGQLQLIDLRSVGSNLKGATVTITVQRTGGGDGDVNIGAINASGFDLKKIVVDGDLGQIDIGTGSDKSALKNLTVGSLGTFGSTTQVPGTIDPLVSEIAGDFGKLTVKGDVQDAIVNVSGKLKKVNINGVLGGDSDPTAVLFNMVSDWQRLIPRVSGGVPGGSFNAGSVGNFNVGGDVMGGSVTSNGDIGSVSVGGDLNSGAIVSEGKIKNVKIKKSLVSDDPEDPAIIAALAKIGGTKAADALALDELRVKGNVENALVLLGYNKRQEGVNPNAGVGKIVVNGNWVASSIAAGVVDPGVDGFGQNDTLITQDGTDNIIAKIASLTIKGTATGSETEGDSFGVTAEQINKLSVNGTKITLDKNALDNVLLDQTNNDFRVIEIVRT